MAMSMPRLGWHVGGVDMMAEARSQFHRASLLDLPLVGTSADASPLTRATMAS
jgi:hypothetical protein